MEPQQRSSEAERRRDHLGDLSFKKMVLVSHRSCGACNASGWCRDLRISMAELGRTTSKVEQSDGAALGAGQSSALA